jgi:hypothetical protein
MDCNAGGGLPSTPPPSGPNNRTGAPATATEHILTLDPRKLLAEIHRTAALIEPASPVKDELSNGAGHSNDASANVPETREQKRAGWPEEACTSELSQIGISSAKLRLKQGEDNALAPGHDNDNDGSTTSGGKTPDSGSTLISDIAEVTNSGGSNGTKDDNAVRGLHH